MLSQKAKPKTKQNKNKIDWMFSIEGREFQVLALNGTWCIYCSQTVTISKGPHEQVAFSSLMATVFLEPHCGPIAKQVSSLDDRNSQ